MKYALISVLSALALACGGTSNQASEPAPAATPEPAPAADTAPANPDSPAEEPPAETAPAAAGGVSDADLEGIYQMMVKIAEVAKATTPNCDPMAEGFEKVLSDNQELLARVEPYGDDEATMNKFQEAYGDKVDALRGDLMTNIQPCTSHEGVMNALQKL